MSFVATASLDRHTGDCKRNFTSEKSRGGQLSRLPISSAPIWERVVDVDIEWAAKNASALIT